MRRAETTSSTPFRCPSCSSTLARLPGPGEECRSCHRPFIVEDGVPLLVRSPEKLNALLADAVAGPRRSWYETPHDRQLVGPYRHHLLKRRAWVESRLRDLPSEQRTVGLDAGCGDGHNFGWLAACVGSLYGTDYNSARARRAADRGTAAGVAVADLEDYAVADHSVDVLFCNHVLEHVPDDARALGELRRVLRLDGTLILGVPNEGAAFWRFAYAVEPRYRRDTDHVHFYTADDLRLLCSDAGLRVVHVEHIGWGLPSWTLDAAVRRFRLVDDLLERVGRKVAPEQATSLYLVARPA